VKALFLGCPVPSYIQSPFIQSDITNGLNNFDKTDRKYSLAPTDDPIRF